MEGRFKVMDLTVGAPWWSSETTYLFLLGSWFQALPHPHYLCTVSTSLRLALAFAGVGLAEGMVSVPTQFHYRFSCNIKAVSTWSELDCRNES